MGQVVLLILCFLRAATPSFKVHLIGQFDHNWHVTLWGLPGLPFYPPEAVGVCHHLITPTPPLPTEHPSKR
ncbi:hypothetical protein BKA57DRAFT_148510 [Linnemannia elongata]|nr:hypothetical protein BKA57DRAFT_148510 [Linnemannia elongata]